MNEPPTLEQGPFGGDRRSDERTSILPVPWFNEAPWPFERLFKFHFSDLRLLREGAQGPGYLIVSFHGNRLMAAVENIILQRPCTARSLVVGRHVQADLCLDADPSVALRHLVVQVRFADQDRPMVRLLDLHTGQGFVVDGAGACESLLSDGHLCVGLGSYCLMLLPISPGAAPWPFDAEEAWSGLSKPVLRDWRGMNVHEELRCHQRYHHSPDFASQVTLLPAVTHMGPESVSDDSDVIGTLTFENNAGRQIHDVTREELTVGLLVGRYERCQARTGSILEREAISRVHMLLLEDDDEVFAVDTASTNGTTFDGSVARFAALPDNCLIELGAGNIVWWHRFGHWAA